jgi:serine/threonine protein kinase
MTQRTPPTVERPPGIDDAIAHYRIVGAAGEASLGRLYVAEQHGIAGVSRIVALGRIRAELVQTPDFRALFFDAASVAARFEHPNVVTIHEMGEVDGQYFVSMEYLPGENLASITARCNTNVRMPPDISASVVKQAANAVEYLHERRAASSLPVGLGYAQVNASNVFVTQHGTVKLLNIGLGPLHLATRPPASGAHPGGRSMLLEAYAAPEQLEGVTDRRTDVFCLGVMLWTCLTGRRPRLASESGEAEGAGSPQHLEALGSMRSDVPEDLLGIATRALSPDPLDRFQSAHALSEELDRYLLRGDGRPTPKQLRRWLEESFEGERASLQLQATQAGDAEGAFALISSRQPASGTSNVASRRASMRPRELWATSRSIYSRRPRAASAAPRAFAPVTDSAPAERLPVRSILVPSEPPTSSEARSLATAKLASVPVPVARQTRSWMFGATLALAALVALGTAALIASSDQSSPFRDAPRGSEPVDRSGRVDVLSTPAGAAVFVDGEPTGLRTPVTLKGLARGRKLKLRVEKAGFAGQEREIELASGPVETHAFELVTSVGLVQFAGAPAGARIYVDDLLVEANAKERVDLAVGRHMVRVETLGSLFFSGTVDVVAGQQTIRVDGTQTTP